MQGLPQEHQVVHLFFEGMQTLYLYMLHQPFQSY